jgi:peptidoglycan hydrolase-like protein with peptidoglycan-binding domain
VRNRRQRKAAATAQEDDFDGSGASRRKDFIAFGAFAAFGLAIMINALFLQKGPHPAPIFANKPPPPSVVRAQPLAPDAATGSVQIPRARPAENEPPNANGTPRLRAEIVTDIQRELTRRGFYDGPADGVFGPKTDAAVRDFEQAAGLKPSTDQGEPLLRTIMRSNVKAPHRADVAKADPIAELLGPSKRVMAVQRVLSDFGYGQIAATGVFGPETQAAIEKFERYRKLPVTGQISDALVRELGAVTGRPLE